MGKRPVMSVSPCSEALLSSVAPLSTSCPGKPAGELQAKCPLFANKKAQKSPRKSGPQVGSVLRCEQTVLPTRKNSKLENRTTGIKATQATAADPKARGGGRPGRATQVPTQAHATASLDVLLWNTFWQRSRKLKLISGWFLFGRNP